MERPVGAALPPKERKRFRNNVAFVKRLFLERFKRYSESHPAALHISEMLGRVNGDSKAEVVLTMDWKDMNAAALPDGTIFVSSKVLRFFEFDEELEFILRHEHAHIKEGHSERKWSAAKARNPLWMVILEHSGAQRLAEYEADVRALIHADEDDVNPNGAIVAMQRMMEAGDNPDIAHGSKIIRILNMQYVTRLIDLPALSAELTPIPTPVKESCAEPDPDHEHVVLQSYDYVELTNSLETRKKTAQRSGPLSAMLEAAELYTRMVNIMDATSSRFDNGTPILQKTQMECDMEVMGVLLKKIDDQIKNEFGDLAPRERRVMVGLVLELVAGCSILEDADEGHDPLGLGKTLAGLAGKGLQRLVDMLERLEKDKELFYFHGDPGSFLEAVISLQEGFDEETLSSLVRLRGCLGRIFEDRGLVEPYMENADLALAGYMLKELSKDRIDFFLACCEAVGIKTGKEKLIGLIVDRFGLDGREETTLRRDPFFRDTEVAATSEEEIERIVDAMVDESICPFEWDTEDNPGMLEPKFGKRKMGSRIQEHCEAIVSAAGAQTVVEMQEILVEVELAAGLNGFLGHTAKGKKARALCYRLSQYILLEAKNMPWSGVPEKDRYLMLVEREPDKWCDAIQVGLGFEQIDRLFELADEVKVQRLEFLQLALSQILWHIENAEDREAAISVLRRFAGRAKLLRGSEETTHQLCSAVFERFRFRPSSKKQLEQLLVASAFIPEYDIRNRLQKKVLEKLLPMLPAEEGKVLLFENDMIGRMEHLDIKEEFIERHISDPGELDGLLKRILDELRPSEETHRAAGKAVLAELALTYAKLNSAAILKMLLSTGKDDSALVNLAMGGDGAVGYDPNDAAHPYIGAKLIMDRLYNLDFETRYAIVQLLLVGKEGALLDIGGRMALLTWFFDEFIEKPETREQARVYDVLRKGFTTIAEKADVSTLYFIIAPLITERILISPKRQTLMKKLEKDPAIERKEKEEVKEFLKNKGGGWRQEVARYMGRNGSRNYEKKAVISFIKEVASRLGAPGVRFLQNLGMYIELPESMREEFSDVYDSVHGQAKLSAFYTLKRQWPGIMGDGIRLGRRVGGGSNFTVYDTMVDDRREVVKVLNPNAEYHAQHMCRLLAEAFSSNEMFAPAVPLIEDIGIWLEADMGFAGSASLEERFAAHDGWTVEGNRYSIRVPAAHLTENARFRREEYVEGINLTHPKELRMQGHDLKAIAGLVVRNAVHQLQTGLVHSDIHPGNISVTEDREVALLDRGYYIELDERDQEFLAALPSLVSDRGALADEIASYLSEFPKNGDIDKERMSRALTEAIEKSDGSAAGLVAGLLIAARQCGCKTPLKLTLILKNAVALDRISRDAGFGNVFEAYSYSG